MVADGLAIAAISKLTGSGLLGICGPYGSDGAIYFMLAMLVVGPVAVFSWVLSQVADTIAGEPPIWMLVRRSRPDARAVKRRGSELRQRTIANLEAPPNSRLQATGGGLGGAGPARWACAHRA